MAKFYSPDIYFAAVNCWRPSGECRAQYPKVSRWPIVVAYFPGIALQYKGYWNFHDLGLFVEKLLKPMERITTSQELFNHKMSNDFVVLGLFEKLDSYYQTFVQAAVKSLELSRNIAFTVFVGNSSKNDLGNLNLTRMPTIKVYTRFSSTVSTQFNIVASKVSKNYCDSILVIAFLIEHFLKFARLCLFAIKRLTSTIKSPTIFHSNKLIVTKFP